MRIWRFVNLNDTEDVQYVSFNGLEEAESYWLSKRRENIPCYSMSLVRGTSPDSYAWMPPKREAEHDGC
jgi:hypothetical protein